MGSNVVFSTVASFADENRTVLAAFTALGALLFLAEDTISGSKGSPLRMLRVAALVAILAVSINLALLIPLEHVPVDLTGKTYLVTGCTSGGIGYETARTLLAWNASTVVCTMRTAEKAEALKASMVGVGPGKFDTVVLELTSFDSVRNAAADINSRFPKLDGVLLNAGLMTSETHITKDGFEEMFQVNHLSQYLLLRLIEDQLAPSSRIAITSSEGYFFAAHLGRVYYETKPGGKTLWFNTLSQFATYGDTKLMNILTANAFAKRLANRNIVANSFCPGLVATNFQAHLPADLSAFIIDVAVKLTGRTPLQGAMRGLHLLTNPVHNSTTATYSNSYVNLPRREVNDDNEKWLFDLSARLVGLSA